MTEEDIDVSNRKWKRRKRIAVAVGGLIVLYLALGSLRENPFGLFAIAGVAIAFVYTFDVPEYLFSAYYAAKKKVEGVEHGGRHDWYEFRGTTIRVFFDERRNPWMAAKEIAHLLKLGEVPEAFRGYRASEFAMQEFAQNEYCLSESGLRRLLKSSQHPEAHPMLLWFERNVLFPLKRIGPRP